MENFKVVIVEDVPLELKGTEGLLKAQVPEAEVIGTASTEGEYLKLMRTAQPDLVLMDLGLQGSTTIGVELCRNTKAEHKDIKILVFTGEVLNEKLWVDVLDAGADGIILKTGEMLTRIDITNVMAGKKYVFNEPIMEQIVDIFRQSVNSSIMKMEAIVDYDIDEYDERFLRHLALGYTKDQIATLKGMPFGVKSLEKRQAELVNKLFPEGHGDYSVNAVRLVSRAFQLHILDIDNLEPDEE
jgi:DNA-binding NarL/FixJ family response regulator